MKNILQYVKHLAGLLIACLCGRSIPPTDYDEPDEMYYSL